MPVSLQTLCPLVPWIPRALLHLPPSKCAPAPSTDGCPVHLAKTCYDSIQNSRLSASPKLQLPSFLPPTALVRPSWSLLLLQVCVAPCWCLCLPSVDSELLEVWDCLFASAPSTVPGTQLISVYGLKKRGREREREVPLGLSGAIEPCRIWGSYINPSFSNDCVILFTQQPDLGTCSSLKSVYQIQLISSSDKTSFRLWIWNYKHQSPLLVITSHKPDVIGTQVLEMNSRSSWLNSPKSRKWSL